MAQVALPQSIKFALPPSVTNAQGRTRTVGVEVEFAGPSAEDTSTVSSASYAPEGEVIRSCGRISFSREQPWLDIGGALLKATLLSASS